MASGKEIRGQIRSVKNTQKITRAMEMVAASKMRKAQDRMSASRPYAQRLRAVAQHISQASPEYHHAYLEEREVKRVGFVVVTSDRGLCGGLNNNLFKLLLGELKRWHDQGVEIDFCPIGQKASMFFRRFGGKVLAQATQLGDAPGIDDVIGVVKVMLDAYDNGEIDRLYVVHNEFVNTMTQKPTVSQLLPVVAEEPDAELSRHPWDYIYEQDAKELLSQILARYIESQVYQGVVENIACEQAARMVAMKSASDNAGNIIEDLQLAYNKARQAAITQELSEIVAGAAAV